MREGEGWSLCAFIMTSNQFLPFSLSVPILTPSKSHLPLPLPLPPFPSPSLGPNFHSGHVYIFDLFLLSSVQFCVVNVIWCALEVAQLGCNGVVAAARQEGNK